MKTIPEKYECEICGRQFAKRERAAECEGLSRKEYPVGLIFGDHTPDAFYKDITFAVAKIRFFGHCNDSPRWACRDNGAGDSVGEEMCGGNFLELSEYDAKFSEDHPTFKRMVKFLKSQNIPITIWNGKEAIPYKG